MALILDKTKKGKVKSNGIDLLTGTTDLQYEDYYGSNLDNPYLVIEKITIEKGRTQIELHIRIFKNVDSRNNNKLPIEKNVMYVNGNDFNDYFTITKQNKLNNNIYKCAYDYIGTKYTNWKSDE